MFAIYEPVLTQMQDTTTPDADQAKRRDNQGLVVGFVSSVAPSETYESLPKPSIRPQTLRYYIL